MTAIGCEALPALPAEVVPVERQDSASKTEMVLGEGKTGPDSRYLLVRILGAQGLDATSPILLEKTRHASVIAVTTAPGETVVGAIRAADGFLASLGLLQGPPDA